MTENGNATQTMCRVFAELLELPEVDADADFFELGGHSLHAIKLISKIRAVFGVELEIDVVFERPTAAGLAAFLDSAKVARPARPALHRMARPAD
jgi:acyl carrier protein